MDFIQIGAIFLSWTHHEGSSSLWDIIEEAEKIAVAIIYNLFFVLDFSFLEYEVAGVRLTWIIGVIICAHMLKEGIPKLLQLPVIIFEIVVTKIASDIPRILIEGLGKLFYLLKKPVVYFLENIKSISLQDTYYSVRFFISDLWDRIRY